MDVEDGRKSKDYSQKIVVLNLCILMMSLGGTGLCTLSVGFTWASIYGALTGFGRVSSKFRFKFVYFLIFRAISDTKLVQQGVPRRNRLQEQSLSEH
jgi:hypothetical protein